MTYNSSGKATYHDASWDGSIQMKPGQNISFSEIFGNNYARKYHDNHYDYFNYSDNRNISKVNEVDYTTIENGNEVYHDSDNDRYYEMNSRYENYVDNIYNKNGNMQERYDGGHYDYFYQPTFLE